MGETKAIEIAKKMAIKFTETLYLTKHNTNIHISESDIITSKVSKKAFIKLSMISSTRKTFYTMILILMEIFLRDLGIQALDLNID